VALLRELGPSSRPITIGAVACVVVGALLPVVFAVATGAAVAAVPAAIRGGLRSPAGTHLVHAVVIVGVILAVWQTLAPVQDAVVATLARRVQARTYRRSLAATVEPRTIAHLETPELLDLVHAATVLTPGGPNAAVRGLLMEARRVLTSVAALLLVAAFHWWLAVLVLSTELYLRRTTRRVYNEVVRFRVHGLTGLRRALYLRGLAMNPDAAKEIRIYGLGAWVVDRFRAAWLETMTEVWRKRKGSGRTLLVAVVPVVAAQFVAVWLMARAAVAGTIGVGAMLAYVQALLNSTQLCLASNDITINEGTAVVEATRQLEEAVASDPRLHLPGRAATPDGAPTNEVRLEGVCFGYPGRDDSVLRDLDLVIPAGRSLAIVGDNGAGKTTLVKLLARLYDPDRGRILVDGTDLRDLDPAGWQRRIAAVFQDFVRFPLTAAENIGFAVPWGERHQRAAQLANASEVIDRLPHGHDTVLTRALAGGVDLSGGEWQRVALARALFATHGGDGGLLILDEPTAQLDARAEASFIDGFLDVTRGCTTIVISHRFSTVRRADRIVVLRDGRVREDGSHDELMAAGGRYAEMFALQAERFGDA
jgi:ATP-binding cassette, subfamily B, bacterial